MFDGSPTPLDGEILNQLGDNINYHHAPVSYQERFAMVERHLETPYVSLLADDDFYLPSAIASSVRFMRKNDEYSACGCRPIGFGYSEREGVYGIAGVYGDMNNNFAVEGLTPGARMREHMGRYMPSTMYALLRTKNWSKTVEPYVKHEFPVYAIMELQMELVTAYQGKSIVLPKLGWLKSAELEQVSSSDSSLQRTVEFHDLWPKEGERFRHEYTTYMADLFREIDHRPLDVVSAEVESAMDAYVNWWGAYCRENISMYDFREKVKRSLPGGLTNAVTQSLRLFRRLRDNSARKPRLLDVGEELLQAGTHVDTDELAELESYISEFHNRVDR